MPVANEATRGETELSPMQRPLSVRDMWRSPHLWWRLGIVVVCAIGLMTSEGQLAFFTTQSNVIVIAYFAITIYTMITRRTLDPPAPRLRGAITLWILVTGLVSHIIINQGASPFPGMGDEDPMVALVYRSLFLLHYVVPALVLIEWVAFGPHGQVRWSDGLLWLLYPIAYGLISLFRAVGFPGVRDRYPYPFLDVDALGAGVVLALLPVLAVIAVLATAVIALDRGALWVARRLGQGER